MVIILYLWYIQNGAPKMLLMAQPQKHPQSESGAAATVLNDIGLGRWGDKLSFTNWGYVFVSAYFVCQQDIQSAVDKIRWHFWKGPVCHLQQLLIIDFVGDPKNPDDDARQDFRGIFYRCLMAYRKKLVRSSASDSNSLYRLFI